jgi:hypothetical protein
MRPVSVFAVLAAVALLAPGGCKRPAETPVEAVEVTATPTTVMPVDAPPQEEVDPALGPVPKAPDGAPGSCLSEVGPAASARLVERCIQVSPATHPPCNAQNSCAMIQDEIDRSCGQYGPDETRPPECTA